MTYLLNLGEVLGIDDNLVLWNVLRNADLQVAVEGVLNRVVDLSEVHLTTWRHLVLRNRLIRQLKDNDFNVQHADNLSVIL